MSNADGQSTAQLAQTLAGQVATLVRTELRLAQAEVQTKARALAIGAGLLAVAAGLLLFGGAAAVAAIVLGLSVVLPAWAAALVTAAGLTLLAGLVVLIGRSMLRRAGPPVPSQALADVKEDVATIAAAARRD
jgi:uncharacterized membrane protein YqjE